MDKISVIYHRINSSIQERESSKTNKTNKTKKTKKNQMKEKSIWSIREFDMGNKNGADKIRNKSTP